MRVELSITGTLLQDLLLGTPRQLVPLLPYLWPLALPLQRYPQPLPNRARQHLTMHLLSDLEAMLETQESAKL